MPLRVPVLTALALIAFAANSVLCRVALSETALDPAAFTALRLASGAVMLLVILTLAPTLRISKQPLKMQGSWIGGLCLFGYALAFSMAYTALPTGTGALLLFGTIQLTLIGYGLWIGERLSFVQTLGFFAALGGVVMLLLPGLGAPPLLYGMVMIGSGLCWVGYTLEGRRSTNATAATAGNFVRATPLGLIALALWVLFGPVGPAAAQGGTLWQHLGLDDGTGWALAIASGAIASGMGYVLWYAVLKDLKVTHVASLQLSVPALALGGGVVILGEDVTVVLLGASLAILLGIALVVMPKRRTGPR